MVRDVTRSVHHGGQDAEDDFPFQLYLRLYQDDVMYEMVNPKDSTWLCAMVLRGGGSSLSVRGRPVHCRLCGGGSSPLIIAVAVFTLYTQQYPTKN